jgi:hypothetical protein
LFFLEEFGRTDRVFATLNVKSGHWVRRLSGLVQQPAQRLGFLIDHRAEGVSCASLAIIPASFEHQPEVEHRGVDLQPDVDGAARAAFAGKRVEVEVLTET